MSKENVALFSKAINKDAALNRRVSDAAPSAAAWVALAAEAGFEFTAEEFAQVVGETLGREVTVENAVHEYLGARYTARDLDVSQRALDAVVGGRMRYLTNT